MCGFDVWDKYEPMFRKTFNVPDDEKNDVTESMKMLFLECLNSEKWLKIKAF